MTEVTPGSAYTVTVDEGDIDVDYDFYVTVPPDVSWYNGTDTTFTISDEADLRAFASVVNAGTDDFTGVTIELDGDITLSGGSWTPVGDAAHNFNGTFDGRGYTISGIRVNSGTYAALFGYTGNGALIKDLRVDGAEIYAGQYAAGVVAYNKGSLENVVNEGEVNAVASGGDIYVGGVAGYAAAAVANCSNTADVTSNAGFTGGVVGYLAGGAAGTPNTLENCFNTGAVTNTGKGGARLGGVAGSAGAYATLRHSYNLGNVTYASASLAPGGVAGVVGVRIATVTVTDVYNQGEVSSDHSLNVIGAVCSISTADLSHACYLQDSIKRGGSTVTPVDNAKVTAVQAEAFSNGEVAYRLKASSGLWTMDPLVPSHPVFSDSADNNLYKIGLTAAAGGDITIDTLIADYAPDTSAYEKAGGTFTLTNTPDAGNILKLLEVRDSSSALLYSYNQNTLPPASPASFTAPAEDLTITAEFAATPVTAHIVTFNNYASLVGGTDTTVTQSVYAMDTAVEPPDPTLSLDGGGITYDFAGWYSDPELTSAYNFHSIVTADITLYAKWEIGDFAGGTLSEPKTINSMAGLIALANAVAAGQDYSGGYFKLNSDVTLPSGWKGIGTESNPFNGSLDGDGHTVTFDMVTAADHPLFNNLGPSAEVHDLNMSGSVTANYTGSTILYAVSSIANTNNGTIRDCSVVWRSISNILGNQTTSQNGGIVATNNGLINNCEVTISLDNMSPQTYLGGIAGKNIGTISDCRLSPDSAINANYFAGICVINTGTVTRCTIGSPDQAMTMTGGMALTSIAISNTGGTISYCKNYANIEETMMMGALVMMVTGGTITHNENHGDVNVQNGNAGGIAWQVSGSGTEVTYNVNYGNITGAIAPTGQMALGGIVAVVGADLLANISYNANHGDIKGGGANFGVGGIIGTLTGGNNTRTISYNYNAGDIEGIRGSAAGGIIGYGNGNETVSHSYSTGNIKSTAEAGALIGKGITKINNSYWFGGSIEAPTIGFGGTGEVTNSYYGSPNDNVDLGTVTGLERLSANRFTSGEVAYLLDGGAGVHKNIWSFENGIPVILPDNSYYLVELLPAANGTITFSDGSTWGYFAEGSTVGIIAVPAPSPDDTVGEYALTGMTVNHIVLGSFQDITGKAFTLQASDATVSAVFTWIEQPLGPERFIDEDDDEPDKDDDTPDIPDLPSGSSEPRTGTDNTGVPDDEPGFGIGTGTEGTGGLINVGGSPTGSTDKAPERETSDTAPETTPEDMDDEETGPAETASEGTAAEPTEPIAVPEHGKIYRILQTTRQIIADNPVASGAVAGCLLIIVVMGGLSQYRNIKK